MDIGPVYHPAHSYGRIMDIDTIAGEVAVSWCWVLADGGSAQDARSVGDRRHRQNAIRVSGEGVNNNVDHVDLGGDAPHFDKPVVRGADGVLSIRRRCQSSHRLGVSCEGVN